MTGASLILIACGNDGDSRVSLAVAVRGSNANALSAEVVSTPGGAGLTLSDGTNTLLITAAEVVLREIELERDDVTDCDGDDDGRDGCEKFETGPRLVSLPLDGGVAEQVITAVPEGTYDRLELEIHKLSDDNGSDILRERPDLADVSIRVVGTFNGAAFVFVSDESFEQRVELDPPVVVGAGNADVNVTLSIDLARWFSTAAGMLVDPSQAADTIEEGIDGTFACFEDDDHDGDDDGPLHDVGDDHGGDDDAGDDDSGSDDADDY
ncbi:MAG: hypothetical protein ACAI38_03705 [Myxococcota bacterium]|nr:hypothetical protein [Myxococcota bacterium]